MSELETIQFEPQGRHHHGKAPTPKPERVLPAGWMAGRKQTGPLEVWFTLLEFIEQARRATGLTGDEILAEALLDQLRYCVMPSRRTVRVALARETFDRQDDGHEPVKRTARRCKVSPRTIRRWREEKTKGGASL